MHKRATYSTTSGVLAEPFSRSCASDSKGIPTFKKFIKLMGNFRKNSSEIKYRNHNESKCATILIDKPRFFNWCSRSISYSIPMKCLARSATGPQRESDSIASFTSKASLVVLVALDDDFPCLRYARRIISAKCVFVRQVHVLT